MFLIMQRCSSTHPLVLALKYQATCPLHFFQKQVCPHGCVQQGDLSYALAVYDGDPATRQWAENLEGLMLIAEAAWQEEDTAYKAGLWQHSAEKTAPDGKTFASDTGVYAIINQDLDGRHGVFLQLGFAQADRNDIANYLGLGFVHQGGFFGRADDTIGLALARWI